MENEIWHVTVDGTQLPGEHETARVRELLTRHAGKQLLVWTQGMADWADPLTLPQFPAQPAAPAASAPAPSPAQPRRPAAPAPSSYVMPTPAAAPRAAALSISPDELQEQAGVFKALFDTSFNTLLAPKLIKAVYLLLMVLLGLGVAGGILMGLAAFRGGLVAGVIGLVMGLVVFPLIAVLYLSIVRMGLEVIMAVFKIKEYTGILAEKARQSDSGRG